MVNRDGSCVSLWQAHADLIDNSYSDEVKHYDVIIVGGGITGITTALLLQNGGKKCLLLEAKNLGFGTTGGTTAHLNTLLDIPYSDIEKNFNEERAALVKEATAEAIQLIRNHIKAYNIECDFSEAEAFLFAQDAKEVEELEKIAEATMKVGIDVTYSKSSPVPIPFELGIRVKGQAKFNPMRYIHGLANAFVTAGGALIQDCRVTETQNGEPVMVNTSQGSFTCNDLVYATHIPPGVNLLHLRCSPYRSYAMAVELNDGNYPADLAYDMKDPYHYYRSQVVDGKKYLIAGGKDHRTGEEQNTNHRFLELEAEVRKHFDVKEVVYQWSSQYFESADGLPYIGHLPGGGDHIYTGTGYGGNGMVYSHVAAMIISGEILGKPSRFAEGFSPSRLKPVAGFKNFLSHNASVAGSLLKKLVAPPKLEELSELARDEARIIRFESEKLAIYKDETGEIHACHPVCKHLGCDVKWNSAEHSWDCPCHGARYSATGSVITGPAVTDLETVELGELAGGQKE